MKIKLYKKWIKFVLDNFPKHRLLKNKNGKYFLALRIWNYRHLYPNVNNWVIDLVDDFLKMNNIHKE